MRSTRRTLLKGATATAGLLVCEAVAKPVTDVLIPRQACGCPRVHEIAYGHTCTVHDHTGKRWDAYTMEDIAADYGIEIDVQTEKTEWACFCGRHVSDDDYLMPVGTRCVWRCTSSEGDEWECSCEASFIADWLSIQTIDWIAAAKDDGLAA